MTTHPKIRLTRRTRRVITALLTDAHNLSGYLICRSAGLGPGSVFPLLTRLEQQGLIVGEWERPDPDGWEWAWSAMGLEKPVVRRG